MCVGVHIYCFLGEYMLFLFSECADGSIVAKQPTSAVSATLLREIWRWLQMGLSMTDVVSRLRTRTVPKGYSYHMWKPGMYSNSYYCDVT